MKTSRQGRYQFFGSSTSSEATPYKKVACSNCRSDASAYKAVFDNEGTNWQTTCFECGQVTAVTQDTKVVRQLRHKCRVRFRLG